MISWSLREQKFCRFRQKWLTRYKEPCPGREAFLFLHHALFFFPLSISYYTFVLFNQVPSFIPEGPSSGTRPTCCHFRRHGYSSAYWFLTMSFRQLWQQWEVAPVQINVNQDVAPKKDTAALGLTSAEMMCVFQAAML